MLSRFVCTILAIPGIRTGAGKAGPGRGRDNASKNAGKKPVETEETEKSRLSDKDGAGVPRSIHRVVASDFMALFRTKAFNGRDIAVSNMWPERAMELS